MGINAFSSLGWFDDSISVFWLSSSPSEPLSSVKISSNPLSAFLEDCLTSFEIVRGDKEVVGMGVTVAEREVG